MEYLVYPMDMMEASVDLNGQWETSGLTLTYFFLYFRAEEMYKLDKIDLLEGFFLSTCKVGSKLLNFPL